MKHFSLQFVVSMGMLLISSPFTLLTAQTRSVSGTVTEAGTGNILPGVSVLVKGTTQGTITDNQGKYSLPVNSLQDTLQFSFLGYESYIVPINGKDMINVSLEPGVTQLDEIVTIGYQVKKRGEITGSVSSIGSKQLATIPTSSALEASLEGRVPGLKVNDFGGAAGYSNIELSVRGVSTLGNNSPLIVVNGVPQDRSSLTNIPSSQIASISVLKDASAAIYGARAANGVILITTKQAQEGKPTITIDSRVGIHKFTHIPDLLDSWESATWENEISERYNRSLPWTDEDIEKFKSGAYPNTHPNTDWFKETYKKYAPETEHTISLSGGSENIQYYVSGNFRYHKYLYVSGQDYQHEYALRANLNAKITDWLDFKMNIMGSKRKVHSPYFQGFYEVTQAKPYMAAYFTNGLPGYAVSVNPPENSYDRTGFKEEYYQTIRPQFQIDLKLDAITEGLGLTGIANYDLMNHDHRQNNYKYLLYSYNAATDAYTGRAGYGGSTARVIRGLTNNEQDYYRLALTYQRNFGDHYFNGFVAYEQIQTTSNGLTGNRIDPITERLMELSLTSTDNMQVSGSDSKTARASYFGSLSYNYKSKYLVDLTFRRDGSYKFATGKKFGNFPSVSAAWNISKEPFMTSAQNWLNNLKLRASWAKMGNDLVGDFQYLATYAVSGFYIFGADHKRYDGLNQNNVPNPAITWETSKMLNFGIDAILLENRLTFNVDYFKEKRRGILIQRSESVPQFTGLTLPAENLGKVDNEGFEVQTNFTDHIGAFQYNIGGNIQYTQNKIVYMDEPRDVPDYQRKEGHPISSELYYKTDGIFNTQSEVDKTPVKIAGTKPGDIKYIDINGDGQIDGNDRYRRYKGGVPDLQYGINLGLGYKGIALQAFFQGQGGGEVPIGYQYKNTKAQWLFDMRWTPDNPEGPYPRPYENNDVYNRKLSDFWLVSTNFIRLKSLFLSYTFPEGLLPVQQAKIYLAGSNLWDIANAMKRRFGSNQYNPEMAITANVYPFYAPGSYYNQLTSYQIGLKITF